MLETALKAATYDCVVIGGGLRLPPKSLALFETVVNIIHKTAPNAAIAFNTSPEDTAESAARQIHASSPCLITWLPRMPASATAMK
jgi:hypothetical protein